MMHITADQAFQPIADAVIGSYFRIDFALAARKARKTNLKEMRTKGVQAA